LLSQALSQAWPPFVLVAGLLAIGAVAHRDGTFARLGAGLERVPGPPVVLFALSCGLLAVVTAILNLDTAVVFITPVIVVAARRRGLGPTPFLYASLFMANASSLYLPGSNLTNLLVLDAADRGSYAATMWRPALAATLVTAIGLGFLFSRQLRAGAAGGAPQREGPQGTGLLGVLAAALAAVAVVLFANPALPVLAIAVVVAAVALLRRILSLREVVDAVSPAVLATIFAVAVGLGVLARAWHGPAHLLAHAGAAETAGIGALGAVLINNLPAAVLLSARAPAHPQALLLGLDLGPNLAVTGSLAAYLWFTAGRQLDLRPRLRTVSAIGIVLAPLAMAAALLLLSTPAR
jgi:arsenical pump membrane protein